MQSLGKGQLAVIYGVDYPQERFYIRKLLIFVDIVREV
jgi:hypothetical protein